LTRPPPSIARAIPPPTLPPPPRATQDATLLKRGGAGRLRTLFLAGERSDPDTVEWVHKALGGGIPVVDNYWQTETGWPVLAIMRGVDGAQPAMRPGSAGQPVPGWDCRVLAPTVAAGSESEFFTAQTDATIHGPAGTQHHQQHTADALKPHPEAPRHHSMLHPARYLPEAETNELGPLVVRLPLPPGALQGLHNAEARFRSGYTDPHPGYFVVRVG
jgi:acyl-coenzyme A synthetase/AMP-(fatty) acid ligase